MIPQPINRTSRRAWPRIRLLRTGRWGLAAVACFLTTAELASAQSSVFRTRRSASSVALPLVVGGGFEFETDSDQTQYDLPFFAQYSFTETFQLSVETALSHIDAKSQAASTLTGIDDLEATLEYELIRERRFAPSFTVDRLCWRPRRHAIGSTCCTHSSSRRRQRGCTPSPLVPLSVGTLPELRPPPSRTGTRSTKPCMTG